MIYRIVYILVIYRLNMGGQKTNQLVNEIMRFRKEMLEALDLSSSITKEAWAVYVQHCERCDKILPKEAWE